MAFDIALDRVSISPQRVSRPRGGLRRRRMQGLIAAQQRRAEREIARYIASGGLNDSAEREIERRFLHSAHS